MKRIFLYSFLLLLLFTAIGFAYENFTQKSSTNNQSPKLETIISEQPQKEKFKVPAQFDLKVPFVPQAPFAVWDDLHNNACEEAAILLVHYYKQNKILSKEKADEEIKKMVDFQIKKYGRHKDLTASEVADLAKEFYGHKNVWVKYDFSWQDVKEEIAKGNPVIVPAAGRLLGNPNYRRPGPIYHMLVIRGYTPKEIITNDPGTRRGEKYKYSYSILDNAIHEWAGSPENIEKGKRAMIILVE